MCCKRNFAMFWAYEMRLSVWDKFATFISFRKPSGSCSIDSTSKIELSLLKISASSENLREPLKSWFAVKKRTRQISLGDKPHVWKISWNALPLVLRNTESVDEIPMMTYIIGEQYKLPKRLVVVNE